MSWRNGYLCIESDPRPGWFRKSDWLSYARFDGKALVVIVVSTTVRIPYQLAFQVASAYGLNLYKVQTIDLRY